MNWGAVIALVIIGLCIIGAIVLSNKNTTTQSLITTASTTTTMKETPITTASMTTTMKDQVTKQYYKNGQLEVEKPYKNGNLDGVWKEFYENGQLKFEKPFKDGNLEGVVKEFYKNGQLQAEKSYKNSNLEGVVKEFNKDGKLKSEEVYKSGFLEKVVYHAQQPQPFEDHNKNNTLALSNMRKNQDKINNTTWYYDKSTPSSNNTNNIHLYFGVNAFGTYRPRLRVCYAGENWLFIQKYIIKADNAVFEIIPSNVDRDNYSTVWEWSDKEIDSNTFQIIQAVINSKTTLFRYNGKIYKKDRTVTQTEKTAMKNVLAAYQALGGTLDF